MGAAVSIAKVISLIELTNRTIQMVMKHGPQFIQAIRGSQQSLEASSSSSRQQDQQQIQMLVQQLRQYENKVDDLIMNQAELEKTIETLMCLNNKITNSVESNMEDNATTTYRVEIPASQNIEDNNEILRIFWKNLSEIDNKSSPFKISDEKCLKQDFKNQSSECDSPVEKEHMDKLSQALAGIVECNICTEHYNDSNRLPCILSTCGHTFCKQCIVRMSCRVREQQGTEFEWYYDSLRCPECRIESELDLDHLTPNDWLLQILDNEEAGSIKIHITDVQMGNDSSDEFIGATSSYPAIKTITRDYEDDDDEDTKSMILIKKLQEESNSECLGNDDYDNDIESMKLIQKLQEEEKSMEYALQLDKEEKLKHREILEKEQMELALAMSLSEVKFNSTS